MTDLLKLADRFEQGDLTIRHNEFHSALGNPFIELQGLTQELSNLQAVSTFEDEFLTGNFDRKVKYNSAEEFYSCHLWDTEGNEFEGHSEDERHARMAAGLRCLNWLRTPEEEAIEVA